jgi:hypothetical protein
MKQTVSISQNMGCNPTIIKTPSIMFPAGNRRPTFDNQLIKKKEFKSINTVNANGPDMNKTTIQIPLKDHVKASYSNGDLKKLTFIGKDDIVNTFYTPPIQIKQNVKSVAGLSSVDTNLLSGLGDMGSNVAKGVALLTMQNILKIDNEGKTSLSSVFSPDKQKKAELALQNYKSRQSSIASSRGWGADEISKKNKESIDLYIGEIEPLINSADEKKAFNEILLSSSSSMTQKLMPFDPTLLTPPTGSSMAQLTTALTTLNTTISAGGVPVGGLPAATTPASPVATLATLTATPAVVKQQPIDQKEIDATIKAMVADAKGNTTDNRLLTIDNLIDIIVEGKLNTEAEFKQIFQTRNQTKMKRGVTKNEIVVAMANNKKAVEYLENIAYGLLMKNQSAADSWTQMKAGTNHKDEYDARILAGNGRKRNKKAQNKAHVNLSEISKILQKYR